MVKTIKGSWLRIIFTVALCATIFAGFTQPSPFNIIAYYDGGPAQLDSFDVTRLNQIIFSFGHLKGNRFHISNARDTATIQKMVSLKAGNPSLKVLLSLGGWGGCETCSDVFSSKHDTRKFVKSFKRIARYFGVDGIDLDWEYPAVAGFADHKFMPEDKPHFTRLLKMLRKKLGNRAEISFAAGVSKKILEEGFEWQKVMLLADRVNLMTYDLAGVGTKNASHHTLLYSTQQQMISSDYAVRYLTSIGVPPEKMVIGAAFYGKTWTDVPDTANGLYQASNYRSAMAYKQMLTQYLPGDGFSYYWDDTAQAPYLYNPSQKLFITYDDKRSVQVKTQYAMDKKLNGIMFWQLNDDTFADGLLQAIYKTVYK